MLARILLMAAVLLMLASCTSEGTVSAPQSDSSIVSPVDPSVAFAFGAIDTVLQNSGQNDPAIRAKARGNPRTIRMMREYYSIVTNKFSHRFYIDSNGDLKSNN